MSTEKEFLTKMLTRKRRYCIISEISCGYVGQSWDAAKGDAGRVPSWYPRIPTGKLFTKVRHIFDRNNPGLSQKNLLNFDFEPTF